MNAGIVYVSYDAFLLLPEIIPQNEHAQLGTDKSSIRFFDDVPFKHLRAIGLALRDTGGSPIQLQVSYPANNTIHAKSRNMCQSQSLDTIYGFMPRKIV